MFILFSILGLHLSQPPQIEIEKYCRDKNIVVIAEGSPISKTDTKFDTLGIDDFCKALNYTQEKKNNILILHKTFERPEDIPEITAGQVKSIIRNLNDNVLKGFTTQISDEKILEIISQIQELNPSNQDIHLSDLPDKTKDICFSYLLSMKFLDLFQNRNQTSQNILNLSNKDSFLSAGVFSSSYSSTPRQILRIVSGVLENDTVRYPVVTAKPFKQSPKVTINNHIDRSATIGDIAREIEKQSTDSEISVDESIKDLHITIFGDYKSHPFETIKGICDIYNFKYSKIPDGAKFKVSIKVNSPTFSMKSPDSIHAYFSDLLPRNIANYFNTAYGVSKEKKVEFSSQAPFINKIESSSSFFYDEYLKNKKESDKYILLQNLNSHFKNKSMFFVFSDILNHIYRKSTFSLSPSIEKFSDLRISTKPSNENAPQQKSHQIAFYFLGFDGKPLITDARTIYTR